MVELVGFALLVTVWFNPRWPVLNKAGFVLFLTMLPSVVIAWFFAPEAFEAMLYWWAVYTAVLLAAGVALIAWRVRRDVGLAADINAPAGAWSPGLTIGVRQFAIPVIKFAAVGAALMAAWMVLLGRPFWFGLLGPLLIGLTLLAPFLYMWLVLKFADIVMTPSLGH